MLLIEGSFSVENLFFYLKLLGKSLKEQKDMILTSAYWYSLWVMSSDSGSERNTFIWKQGRMMDKTSFLHTVACGGCIHAGSPRSLSLSAEGKESEGIGSTALKTTYFSPCTEIGAANEAAQLPHTADLQNLTLT